MTTTGDQNHEYEFDVAVSFAGEDRDYVEEVVQGVKQAGHKIFYDDDHVVEMWGEDGVEYLSNVYQNRARFVVMFVSRHYAEKMWTRLERRSALARAITQKGAYILPVRLDDTHLEGLLPTVIYLDANRTGLSGLIEAIKVKLGSAAHTEDPSGALRKVPRSSESIQAMLNERPPAWEYLLYAGVLRTSIDALDSKHRDHMMGFAPRTQEFVDQDNVTEFAQAALADAQNIAENFGAVLDEKVQEDAFGAPGEPGDPARILHMAERFVSVYEDFMDWAARLRGASIQGEHARTAMRALAKTADANVESLRSFVDTFVGECDTLLERADAGEKVNLIMTVHLSLDEALMGEFNRELKLAVEGGDD